MTKHWNENDAHGSDCAIRFHSAAECTCGKADYLAGVRRLLEPHTCVPHNPDTMQTVCETCGSEMFRDGDTWRTEITITVQVSIPVGLAFDEPFTLADVRRAAIANFIEHPALKNARDLDLYIDSIGNGDMDVTKGDGVA